MNEHRPLTEAEAAQLTPAPASADTQPAHHGAGAPSQRELDDRAAAAALADGRIPEPHPDAGKIRILWVFAWLVVGGEETEVRLLARTLDRTRYRIDVIPCFRKEGMPDLSHEQLRALGVHVDTTAYGLSFEDTIDYLRRKIAGADIVVSSQNVADIYPALDRLADIVRGADTARLDLAPEAAGLLAASLGLSRMYSDDLEQLEAGMPLYDAFYRWARDATDETHNWPTNKPKAD